MTISGSKSSRIEGSGRRRDSSYRRFGVHRFGVPRLAQLSGPSPGRRELRFLLLWPNCSTDSSGSWTERRVAYGLDLEVGAGLHSVASEHFLVGGERDGE